MSIEPLSKIVMAIYESALTTEGWFNALREIAEISGSAACRIVAQDGLAGSFIYSVAKGVAAQSVGHEVEVRGTEPSAGGRELIPLGEPICHSRTADQFAVAESGVPWQVQREEQLSDLVTVVLLNSGGTRILLEAVKAGPGGCYSDRDIERMRLIGSHLCRSIRISDSLSVSRSSSKMFEASLELLSTAVYFVGPGTRVVYLNRVARAQVKSGTVLRVVGGHLAAANPGAQKLLQAELREIASTTTLKDRPRPAIALADGEGGGYVAHVLPFQRGAQSRIAHDTAAIAAVFVHDPATVPLPAHAAFAKLYGLTEAELRLLNSLVPGLTLAETAKLIGISEATAKTQLRRIFAKTKTSKQAELLNLLMTSTPPTIAP